MKTYRVRYYGEYADGHMLIQADPASEACAICEFATGGEWHSVDEYKA